MTTIKRGFVDVAAGQIHYRHAGQGGTPLVMLHASPSSAKQLEPLIGAFAASRRVIAPDTMGNGDSSPAPQASPTIEDLAAGAFEAVNNLGLERFDLYGTHTGASIAATIAIAHPDRVRKLVLDGVGIYEGSEQKAILDNYLPEVPIDTHGLHALWAWSFVRDMFFFWPWFARDKEHARAVGLPSPDALHDKYVEVLKGYRSFRKAYRAAFTFDKRARLPLIRVPTLAVCARSDMLFPYLDAVEKLIPGSAKAEIPGVTTPEAARASAEVIDEFLRR
jgi:pimeloyl-ACP methyl ester carboxylesterase